MKILLYTLTFLIWGCFTDNENDSPKITGNLGNISVPIIDVDTISHLINVEKTKYECIDSTYVSATDTLKTHYQFINDTLILTNLQECTYIKFVGTSKNSIYGTWTAIIDSSNIAGLPASTCNYTTAKDLTHLSIGIVNTYSMTRIIGTKNFTTAYNGTICMADAVLKGMTDALVNIDPRTEFTKLDCNKVSFLTGTEVSGTIEYIENQKKGILRYTVDGKSCDAFIKPMSAEFNANTPACPIEMSADETNELYSCVGKLGL